MLKHTISELKEALLCLQAGQVTLAYPFEPHPVESTFRGLPILDVANCIGCGACVKVCPSRLIETKDDVQYRTLTFSLGRCTYCASCRDICPQKAIAMSTMFETATSSPSDLEIQIQLKLVQCKSCGSIVGTQRMIDLIKLKLEELDLHLEGTPWLDYCETCKRHSFLTVPMLSEEVCP